MDNAQGLVDVDLKTSLLGVSWQKIDIDESWISEITQKLQINDTLARLLASRVSNITEAKNFLEPKIRNLMPDPFHLIDMEKAAARTYKAIKDKELIHIFADYDVDGATSSACLARMFKDLGVQTKIYIPDRIKEGYGPSCDYMEKIASEGAKLVIILDCGTSSHEPIAKAKELGIDVVVIDHHQGSENLPPALGVVNPNRFDQKNSPCKNLAAAGVSWMFAAALLKTCRENAMFSQDLPEPDLLSLLDLVGLGTVCDVMQLTGLNRAFVAQGLKIINKKNNVGIGAIFETAGANQPASCYHLGYIIGPRINAGGRVGDASLGAQILSTNDKSRAREIASQLEIYNAQRKNVEAEILKEAEMVARQKTDDPLIFAAGQDWHQGVIGIVAGRLKEQFDKPSVVATIMGDTVKASCRSVLGVDFAKMLIEAKEKGLLIAGGGHAMAGGFTAHIDNIEALRGFLCKKVESYNLDGRIKTANYDIELSAASFSGSMIEFLKKLEPFGNGNPAPAVLVKNLRIINPAIVGSKHIKCILASSKVSAPRGGINAIAFNAKSSPLQDTMLGKKGELVSAIGTPQINHWQGRESLQLIIKDLIA